MDEEEQMALLLERMFLYAGKKSGKLFAFFILPKNYYKNI